MNTVDKEQQKLIDSYIDHWYQVSCDYSDRYRLWRTIAVASLGINGGVFGALIGMIIFR